MGSRSLRATWNSIKDFFAALEKTSPFAMGFEALSGSVKGRCNYEEKRILINEGMDELQNIKTAIHEIAHATLHDTSQRRAGTPRPSHPRGTGGKRRLCRLPTLRA